VASDDILRRIDEHMGRGNELMERIDEHMGRGNELMERIDVHMARNEELMQEVREEMQLNRAAYEHGNRILSRLTRAIFGQTGVLERMDQHIAELTIEVRAGRRDGGVEPAT
jgi:uncharacterized coiled-coil DUF342 family protein